MFFGPHLILDLSMCDNETLGDIELVRTILMELPEKIGMTRISEPEVFRYSGKVPEDCGVTGVVVLAESHCSIHTFQEKGYCFVDIFSCKQFDHNKAIKELTNAFDSKITSYKILKRGAGFPRRGTTNET